MDLKALLLIQGVIVGTCLSTFVAVRQLAPEPSASPPSASSSSSSLCSRELATTLWGAAFAFFSLMADAWPASKAARKLAPEGHSLRNRLMTFVAIAPVAQLCGIGLIIEQMFTTLRFRQILKSATHPELGPDTMSMSNKLRRGIDDILVILFGINQSPGFLKSTRIVANTYIVLGMSDSTKLPPTHIDRDHSPVNEDNMADALALGHKTAENSCLMELNEAGKLALMESSILPNYKQLRFLYGRSGIATLIIGVQAIGYVTSIVYRAIHPLPVSPIETIGFAFSMLVIVHSVLHSVAVICQNPLVIYFNPTQEQDMLDKCESTRWSNVDDVSCGNAMILGMVVVGTVVVTFTILVEWQVLRKSWLDAIGPILFLLSLITQLFSYIVFLKYLDEGNTEFFIYLGFVMISFGGIVVSIVATILNWQMNKFDCRTPSVIHNLPFLG
ncbi:unnamed protein product [Sphagnum troendelagicum]|uniref:Uncharacterized protein n=1 Tax=Sphagnum troendelagicum TaxID=128251 RepID=A0ABP0UCD4_9BRYO